MDESVTGRHMRCWWNFSKFFIRDLFCPQFTNAKAFTLGVTGLQLYNHVIKDDYSNFIPPITRWLLIAVITVEGLGLLARVVTFYEHYFAPCCVWTNSSCNPTDDRNSDSSTHLRAE